MALLAKGTQITMDYGDYGIQLAIDVEGAIFEDIDTMLFKLKKSKNSRSIIKKEYTNEYNGNNLFRFFLDFTKKESQSIPPGNYVYYIVYLKDGEARHTIVSGESFKIKN